MRRRILDYINNCVTCLVSNLSVNSREGKLQITNTPLCPFEVIHVDHFGPLDNTTDGSKHVLVIIIIILVINAFTWFHAVKSTSSKETIKYLASLFQIFGPPKDLVSDRGTAFTSREFSDFVSSFNIKHRLIAVAALWANGICERVNRFLKSSLKKIVEDLQTWNLHIDAVQYINNTFYYTFHTSILIIPFILLSEHLHLRSFLNMIIEVIQIMTWYVS